MFPNQITEKGQHWSHRGPGNPHPPGPTSWCSLLHNHCWGGILQLFNSKYHHLYFTVGCKVKMIIILIERAWETLRKHNIIIQTGNCQVVPILVRSSMTTENGQNLNLKPQHKFASSIFTSNQLICMSWILFLRYLECSGSVSSTSVSLPVFSRHRERKLSQGYNSISLNQHLSASSSKACLIHLEPVVKEYTL